MGPTVIAASTKQVKVLIHSMFRLHAGRWADFLDVDPRSSDAAAARIVRRCRSGTVTTAMLCDWWWREMDPSARSSRAQRLAFL